MDSYVVTLTIKNGSHTDNLIANLTIDFRACKFSAFVLPWCDIPLLYKD